MSLRSPRLWIGLCSGLVVLLAAFVDMGRKSPGPLSAVHQGAGTEGPFGGGSLSAAGSCSACHGGLFGDMQGACLECHGRIGEQVELGAGLHGGLDQGLLARCGSCHSEHHGSSFPPVNDQSFALAGVPDREAFDHRRVGFAMEGAHLELDCTECHRDAEAEVLAEGHFRYGGLSQDCSACHEDVHAGAMEVSCADCHGQTDWDELFAPGHDRVLPLVGGHAGTSCRDCHRADELHALEVVGGRGPRPAARACLDCHPSPHDGDFAAGAADALAMPLAASCVACHEHEHQSFREPSIEVEPGLHARSGFPLEAPHAGLECAACHDPEQEDFERRFPGRAPEECSRCHADPHEGQFELEGRLDAGGSSECTACHAPHRWDPPAFDAEQHAATALPLDGAHLEVDCHDCHEIDGGGARVFRGTVSDCDLCHADAHRHFFDAFEDELARAEHGTCAACHRTEAFSSLPEGGFDHARFTGFPVRGAHAQEDCEACHARADEPDSFGRTFGFVHEQFGPVEGCESCHRDPHQGAFDGPEAPRRVDGREGCARCHLEVSFRVFERGFDHQRWTGYELEDAHARLGCTDCHQPRDEPDEHGLTWGPAAGTACSDCHADPHGSQFEDLQGRQDCARCHTAARFSATVFRHDWDSTFELGEAHRELACSACHPLEPHEGGRIVRYRPLASDCVDCHGLQQGRLLRRKRGSR